MTAPMSEYHFKITISYCLGQLMGWYQNKIGEEFIVEEAEGHHQIPLWRVVEGDWTGYYIQKSEAKVEEAWLKPNSLVANFLIDNKSMQSARELFAASLRKEPQKSFQKAGITNGDDLLTEDGKTVFLSWLLHSVHADQFKKDVVDPMIKEIEKQK